MTDLHKIAMELIPLGTRPSLVALRTKIAETMKWLVKKEIEAYVQQSLPAVIKEIADEARSLKSALIREQARMDREQREFKLVAAGHLDMLTAVEKWIEWCDGKHQHDDRETLWGNVKLAHKAYRSLKSSEST